MAEEEKKYTLRGFTIRDLEKAEGVSDKTGKPWIRFKFKTTDAKAKDQIFTYFPYGGLTKPENWPQNDVKVTSMTFTMVKEGQYEGDCSVKKIIYDPASKPPPAEEDPFGETPAAAPSMAPSQTMTKDHGICLSYYKDMMIARLAWDDHKILPSVKDMGDQLAREGTLFYQDVINNLKKLER